MYHLAALNNMGLMVLSTWCERGSCSRELECPVEVRTFNYREGEIVFGDHLSNQQSAHLASLLFPLPRYPSATLIKHLQQRCLMFLL